MATLSLQLAYTLITQLTTSHVVWSKFLDTKFIKANDWKKKQHVMIISYENERRAS